MSGHRAGGSPSCPTACVVRAVGTRAARYSDGPTDCSSGSYWLVGDFPPSAHPSSVTEHEAPWPGAGNHCRRAFLQLSPNTAFFSRTLPQTWSCHLCERSGCLQALGPTCSRIFYWLSLLFLSKIFYCIFSITIYPLTPFSTYSSMLIFDFYIKPVTVCFMIY